jgi:hypothetical protein
MDTDQHRYAVGRARHSVRAVKTHDQSESPPSPRRARSDAPYQRQLAAAPHQLGSSASSRGCAQLGACLAVLFALNFSGLAANRPITIDSNIPEGTLEVRFKGHTLLVYAFATNQFKPYLRELYSLTGENVLRDAPPDHLHHHGMMYAVCVNGINFWEEKGAPGMQKHIEMPLQFATIDPTGVAKAEFMEVIHWLAPTNRPAEGSAEAALLLEQRKLTVSVDETNQEVALRWESRFQVGPEARNVKLHGPNYDGLGLRLPESFNHVAAFQNSAGTPYTGKNTQNVIPARWTSVAGRMGGRDLLLVLFGRAENPAGDSLFFTMLDPFAYLSATQGLDQKPLEYTAGDKFSLSYLLTVYSENKPAEFITRRSELWEKERR